MSTRAEPASGTSSSERAPRRALLSRSALLWLYSLLIGLGSSAVVWGTSEVLRAQRFNAPGRVQGAVYDAGMTRFAQRASERPGPVAVVEIGETTRKVLEKLPPFLPGVTHDLRFREGDDERAFHVRLLENLRKLGARAVVFDIVFEDRVPEWDGRLAAAIRAQGHVVLAAMKELGGIQSEGANVTLNDRYPNETLLGAAAGMGVANVVLDPDESALRSFPWYFKGIDPDTADDLILPSLGVAAAAEYAGRDPKRIVQQEIQPHHTFLGRPIRWTYNAALQTWVSLLRYFGVKHVPSGPGSAVSYEDVFFYGHDPATDTRLREAIRGKVVLVGDASLLGQDSHRVPVISGDTHDMPGVEIQAQVIQTVLSGRTPVEAPYWGRVLLVLLTCIAAAIVGRLLPPIPFVVVAGAGAVALVYGSIELLDFTGWWLEPVTACTGLATTVGFEAFAMYFLERKQRMYIRRQLNRQVGPGVADRLTEEEWPELGGESREITLLFSDLQGFTSLSETMSSEQVCALLNRYFGVLLPVVFKHGGALDKLMGDGMMAYFGWPRRHPDHAARAVRCACEAQDALREWLAKPENAGLPPLRTRIGVHTGYATVGEIGHGERAEFTVIGDIVNVASRLEGMNKEFGTTILISETTRAEAGDAADTVYRGEAHVRGRKEPIGVYCLTTEAPEEQRKPEAAAAAH